MHVRTIGNSNPLRVAIADDSGLVYSDDYREGWVWGFRSIGCEVKVFDVHQLRVWGTRPHGRYSAGSAKGYPKMMGQSVASFKPDLVWCHHGRGTSSPAFLEPLHRAGVKTAVYLCDEPYEVGETAGYSPNFTHVFTMDPCTIDVHRLSRPGRRNVYYLPPAVNTDLFKLVPYAKRAGGVFFLGNAGLQPRTGWLKPVEKVLGAEICFWPGNRPVAKGDPRWIPLEDHPRRYADCYVGLNVHRHPGITMQCYKKRILARNKNKPVPAGLTLAPAPPKVEGTGFWNDGDLPADHICPRFFEMAACGTLVVSDASRPELARLFPMAPRAVDPEHFLELCHYYLEHTDEAEEIGRACSYLISKRHSYRHRAAEVLIRLGLKAPDEESLVTSLGEPADWLSQQHFALPKGTSLSVATGPSERWSPAYGLSSTRTSGKASEASSLDAPTPWLA